MKKIIFIAAAMLMMAFNANAQFTIGAGYAYTGGNQKVADLESVNYYQNGVYGELQYNIQIVDEFSIAPGARFTYGTSSKEWLAGIVGKNTDMKLAIPVECYATAEIGACKLSAFAGPQFNYIIKSETKIETTGTVIDWTKDNTLGYSYNKCDFGIVAGIAFDMFNHLRIKGAYYIGLLDCCKAEKVDYAGREFSVGLAYIF